MINVGLRKCGKALLGGVAGLTAVGFASRGYRALEGQEKTPLPPPSVETKVAKKKAKAAQENAPPAPAAAPIEPTGPVPNAKGDIGYNATKTTSATKTDTELRNIPQSISVVTEQQI